MWEALESHWQYSSQSSLLRTYSATTAPHTPACRNRWNILLCPHPLRECDRVRVRAHLSDLRLQHSQQRVRLWNLLELIGLVPAQTNDVAQSLRCIGLPLWETQQAHMNIQFCKLSIQESLSSGDSAFYIKIRGKKCPSTSSSLSGWMSSMSLCASFSSFSHCWEKSYVITAHNINV